MCKISCKPLVYPHDDWLQDVPLFAFGVLDAAGDAPLQAFRLVLHQHLRGHAVLLARLVRAMMTMCCGAVHAATIAANACMIMLQRALFFPRTKIMRRLT